MIVHVEISVYQNMTTVEYNFSFCFKPIYLDKTKHYTYVFNPINDTKNNHNNSIQIGGIKIFCTTATHFDLGVLGHFALKNQTRKIDKFIKILELYQVFMHNFFVSKCPNIPKLYMTFEKNQHILIWKCYQYT